MGFFGGAKKITVATGKAAFKAGAYVTVVAGKGAGKGSVWVLKKVAVDPAKNKITDWKLVKNASAVRNAIQNGECAGCGRKFNNKGGKVEFCKLACAMAAAESWNKYEKATPKVEPVGAGDTPYLTCNCNRNGLFHGGVCTLGLDGDRIKENIRWSSNDPRHMDPSKKDKKPEPPKRKPVDPGLAERARKIAETPVKKKGSWW